VTTHLIADGQLVAALATTACEDGSAVAVSHSFAETVLVATLPVRGFVGKAHCSYFIAAEEIIKDLPHSSFLRKQESSCRKSGRKPAFKANRKYKAFGGVIQGLDRGLGSENAETR